MIIIRCPHCGEEICGGHSDLGCDIKCPNCGKYFRAS